jgi:hypothetical protein
MVGIPQDVVLTGSASDKLITLSWSLPDGEVPLVFAFKVTLKWLDVSSEEWRLNNKWNGKVYRTYTDNVFTAIPPAWGLSWSRDAAAKKTRYTLVTGAAAIGTGDQKVEVVTFNLDGQDSAPAEALWQAQEQV